MIKRDYNLKTSYLHDSREQVNTLHLSCLPKVLLEAGDWRVGNVTIEKYYLIVKMKWSPFHSSQKLE